MRSTDLPAGDPKPALTFEGEGIQNRVGPRGKGRRQAGRRHQGGSTDGKDFTLYFDKESGLPVKLVATVVGFGGDEFTQETTFKDYEDFDGIKKATKADSKRNGVDLLSPRLPSLKSWTGDAKTFSEPE